MRYVKSFVSMLLCMAMLLSLASCKAKTDVNDPTEPPESESQSAELTELLSYNIDDIVYPADLGGIKVLNSYNITGKFNEDGSGREVADVAGLVLYNPTGSTLQYLKFTATYSDGAVYTYSVSTVPSGATCDVAEESAAPFRDLSDEMPVWNVEAVAYFSEDPSLLGDYLKFTGADGILTVTNISGEDISGDIVVYYKDYNSEEGYLSSGITYRVTITGGVEAGGIRQVTASHYTREGSMLMFAEITESSAQIDE